MLAGLNENGRYNNADVDVDDDDGDDIVRD